MASFTTRKLRAAVLVPFGFLVTLSASSLTVAGEIGARIDSLAESLEEDVIAWRRDFHAHPELSNREHETAEKIADHLRELGMDVTTGVAHTGVVGVLNKGKDGPAVALRADMDALPVTEALDLPFASKVTTTYRGQETGVMHACGHDAHMAILLGAATILSELREELPGPVLFIFQPAEEGAPDGEEGGASLMLEEGLFDILRPDVVFGLHVWSSLNAGVIGYRSGPFMASSDAFRIQVRGRQTHGSKPWGGVDPIVTAAQIVMGLQTIPSRQMDLTASPVVVSVGAINGGIRNNIIPDQVEMIGTVRGFDAAMREEIPGRIERTATNIAESTGASVDVNYDFGYPVTVNDPQITSRMLPTLERVAGKDNVVEYPLITGAEDFSYYLNEVPGMFFMLGATPPGQDPAEAPANHSPRFFIDENTLQVGVRALTELTTDFMGVESRAP